MNARKVVLIPGDGIGPEISEAMQDLGGNINTPEFARVLVQHILKIKS